MKTRRKMFDLRPIKTSKLAVENVLCYMSREITPLAQLVRHCVYCFVHRFHFHDFSLHRPSLKLASLTEDSLLNARTVQASGNVPWSSFQICVALCFHERTQRFTCFQEKDVLKLYSDMISKLSEGLTRQGFLEFPRHEFY